MGAQRMMRAQVTGAFVLSKRWGGECAKRTDAMALLHLRGAVFPFEDGWIMTKHPLMFLRSSLSCCIQSSEQENIQKHIIQKAVDTVVTVSNCHKKISVSARHRHHYPIGSFDIMW